MKKILVTQRLDDIESYGEIRESLDIQWGVMFKEFGVLPVIVSCKIVPEYYFKNFDISAVVFTGGGSVYSIDKDKLSKLRDEMEISILETALDKNIPILGICRGMQFVIDFFGGKLEPVDNHVAVKHSIKPDGNNSLSIYLNNIQEVNSYHDYRVTDIPANFNVAAYADDGTIEAVIDEKNKIFCQMWHSERMNPFVAEELDLIKAVINW